MSEEKGTRVYVGNLTDKIKKEHLEEEFTKFGKLNSVWVAFNPPGFAFIEFAKKEEAESACDSLNGQEVLGSKLRVEISKGRARNARGGGKFRGSGGPRQGGGGFRGRSGFGGGREFGSRSGGGSGGGFRGGRGGRSGFGGGSGSRPSGGYGNRDGNRDSYGGGNRYGGSNSGSGGGGGAGSRFRSRSPHGNRRF